jgi:hypothetical protein
MRAVRVVDGANVHPAVHILADAQIRLELPRVGHCIKDIARPPAEFGESFLKFDDLRNDAGVCYDWSCATLSA